MSDPDGLFGGADDEPARVAAALADLGRYLEPDTARLSLPPLLYTSAEVFALEEERIVARDWFCVGRSSDLPVAGAYVCLTIGSEPVVVTRRSDGGIQALSPICRHRLMPVVECGSGTADRFTCPYHLWKYGLDGRLVGAPYMRDTVGFDPSAVRLPAMASTEWNGFVFVNLDPDAEPLGPRLAEVTEDLRRHQLDGAVEVARYDLEWNANWKVAVENASESYHHMGLHADTVEPVLPTRGTRACAGTDWWAHHRTPVLDPTPSTLPTLTSEDLGEAKVYTLFPSTVILTTGELCNWQTWIPLGPDRTRVLGAFLLPPSSMGDDPTAVRAAMQAVIEAINAEDRVANEAIQRAAASRSAERGFLSAREASLSDFHRYLARRLREPDAGEPGRGETRTGAPVRR